MIGMPADDCCAGNVINTEVTRFVM